MTNVMNLDFPLKGDVTKTDIKKAQDRLIDITEIVVSILEKNKIRYTIMFGTLLGAVRHGGFIPWDLDIDLAIPEEDYMKCIEHVRNGLPKGLVLQDRESDSKYCAFWTKVVDINSNIRSTEYQSDNLFTYTGLHLDLYMLKKTSDQNHRYDILNDNLDYYKLKYDRRLMSKNEYEEIISSIKNETCEKMRVTQDNDKYYFLTYLKTDIDNVFPTQTIQYDRLNLQAPNNYHQVLCDSYYGKEYMTPPAYGDRDIKVDKIEFYD